MSMSQENRVLCRIGARHLDEQELHAVSGGRVTTEVCTVPNPVTLKPDGDCD